MPRRSFPIAIALLASSLLSACAGGEIAGRSAAPSATTATAGTLPATQPAYSPQDREKYDPIVSNPVTRVAEKPVSTFSIDVDTAAYANVRRFLEEGRMPPRDAVRVEELINYFRYDYPAPDSLDAPFSLATELAPTPWNTRTHLLHIGIKGYEVERDERPDVNLVFLVDVSGSMNHPDKLPLVKRSLQMLAKELRPGDRVAIAVYAGAAGVVLEPTPGDERRKILAALERLRAGGSTAGGAGLELAYALAEESFDAARVNRVILATDGDFNVGVTDPRQLVDLITEKRESGIALSVLGFGAGNYQDALMERVSNAGNGNAAYIDSLKEARKVLVEEMNATLLTIAKDVKIQIEFNPAQVAEYRLIGYENRLLRRQDFRNDQVDAGDIGAGHSITAIYEIALTGRGGARLPDLRYQKGMAGDSYSEEIAFLKLRFKPPKSDRSQAVSKPIFYDERSENLSTASENFRFAAAVAAFGQLLRGGELMEDYTLADAIELAKGARGADPWGYRSEFLQLVHLAESLGN